MPSLQLQLVISPSVVHVRDLKLFFLKAPKASLVLFIFSIALNSQYAFLREISEKINFFIKQHNSQQSGSPNSMLIHPAKSNAICKLTLICKLHKTKKCLPLHGISTGIPHNIAHICTVLQKVYGYIKTTDFKPFSFSFFAASMGGALVRALASHQYGRGSDPGLWVEFVVDFLPCSVRFFPRLLQCSP